MENKQIKKEGVDEYSDELFGAYNDMRFKEFSGILVNWMYTRYKYLEGELSRDGKLGVFIKKVLKKPLEEMIDIPKAALEYEKNPEISLFNSQHIENWGDVAFHLRNRVTDMDTLEKLFLFTDTRNKARDVIEQGYDLSILPLNILINSKEVLNKFTPKEDFFKYNDVKQKDPYGIFDKGSLIVKEGIYIGSQKFPRSLLFNITDVCPHGCVGCYKGEYTRVKGEEFFTNLAKAVSVQTDKLVECLNNNPNVESIIMSGGEPLMLTNEGMKKVLDKLKDAKYLTEFRICTGTIFQGLPFRIDDQLLAYLKDFEDETGTQVHFNAHLSHPKQFTPEALTAIKKIKDKGFYINTQVPLQRDVNIFPEDKEKTLDTLYELTRLQGASGIRPYKYIVHMNSGSLEYSVPLEFILDIIGELKYRPDHPWPETWQPVSASVLCKAGNILLSPQLVFGMEKMVNREQNYVEYKIPVPQDSEFKVARYKEPLMLGYNDDPTSLDKIRDKYHSSIRRWEVNENDL